MRLTDASTAESSEEPTFPEDADTVLWVAKDGFHLNNPEDYEECLPEDLDISDTENAQIIFDVRDELPIPIARDFWDTGFRRYMAAFDADGERLDEPDRRENRRAIKRWLEENGHIESHA